MKNPDEKNKFKIASTTLQKNMPQRSGHTLINIRKQ